MITAFAEHVIHPLVVNTMFMSSSNSVYLELSLGPLSFSNKAESPYLRVPIGFTDIENPTGTRFGI